MRIHRKLAIAAGAGVAGLGLFGMVALAAFAPDTGGGTRDFVAPTGAQSAVEKPKPQDKLKDLLDGLVAKALANKRISDDQAKTLRDGLPAKVNEFVDRKWPVRPTAAMPSLNVKGVLGDLLAAGRSYLGVPIADLRSQLAAGKSLGDIANATNGKSRDGLVAALTNAANARIDQAASDKKLTADQTKTLKDKVAAEIATFVGRKMTPPTGG